MSLSLSKLPIMLNMCYKEFPELESKNIQIVFNDFFASTAIGNTIKICYDIDDIDNEFKNFFIKYIYNEFKLDLFLDNISIEDFAFLHEVGHIYLKNKLNQSEQYKLYEQYENTIFDTIEDELKSYRGIQNEYLADCFAVGILKKYKNEIYTNQEKVREKIIYNVIKNIKEQLLLDNKNINKYIKKHTFDNIKPIETSYNQKNIIKNKKILHWGRQQLYKEL